MDPARRDEIEEDERARIRVGQQASRRGLIGFAIGVFDIPAAIVAIIALAVVVGRITMDLHGSSARSDGSEIGTGLVFLVVLVVLLVAVVRTRLFK